MPRCLQAVAAIVYLAVGSHAVTAATQNSPEREAATKRAIARTIDRATLDPSILEFPQAKEKWACRYRWGNNADVIDLKFGIFNTHVEDDSIGIYSLVQNDDTAVVFADSDFGSIDIEGKAMRFMETLVIEKYSRDFTRLNYDRATNRHSVASGTCSRF